MTDQVVLNRIRAALDSGEVGGFAELLAPDVTWGAPGSNNPPCKSDHDVMRWYQRGFDRGIRGKVFEVSAFGNKVLIGMIVTGNPGAENGAPTERWQVLAMSAGLVKDIRGYEDRASAVAAVTGVS
jgi:hypothetical protein